MRMTILRESLLCSVFGSVPYCSYEASVKAVMEGRKKLKENGIPYLRPDDYLAEMMKDDKKMKMIEQKKTAIEEEKRQKLRKIIIRNKNKKRSNRKKYSRRK